MQNPTRSERRRIDSRSTSPPDPGTITADRCAGRFDGKRAPGRGAASHKVSCYRLAFCHLHQAACIAAINCANCSTLPPAPDPAVRTVAAVAAGLAVPTDHSELFPEPGRDSGAGSLESDAGRGRPDGVV